MSNKKEKGVKIEFMSRNTIIGKFVRNLSKINKVENRQCHVSTTYAVNVPS